MGIYPKLAANRSIAVNVGTCFLLMPFSREMRPVHAAIKEVCESLHITCERADDIYSQRPIFASVLNSILSSEVIVADLSGKNPNVFYETGIAHSVREAQSVILIAQTLEDVPFDLQHLPIILYKLENMQKFEIELEKRILHSQSATSGVNFAANYLFPLNFQPHDVRSFIDYAGELSNSFFSSLVKCISQDNNEKIKEIAKDEVEDVFRTLQLASEANNGRWRRICDHLKMEILTSEAHFSLMKEKCLAHLQHSEINQYDISERSDDFFSADLAFKLIGRNLIKKQAINWVLGYLHNPRMGNIDVVRYKIEAFIVESDDPDISSALLSLLSTDSPQVRENVADMIGQKSITNAAQFLENSLEIETNPYTARSLITALARQNASNAVATIVEWVKRHADRWWEEPISLTLQRVASDTVKKLAPNSKKMRELQDILSSGKSEKRE